MLPRGEAKQLLVRHAVELLEEVGLAEFTGREVARRAGVSHGAPRRHFPSLAALLSAVCISGFEDLKTDLATASQACQGMVADQIAAVAGAYAEFAIRRPALFELMFRHDLLADSGEGLRQHSLGAFAIPLELVIQSGAKDPQQATVDLWAGIHGIAVLASRKALGLVTDEPVPDLVTRQVRAHLSANSAT